MTSGVNGPCDRPCTPGRPHWPDCRNRVPLPLPAAEHIQKNIESLAAIGGLYDFIAWSVEDAHKDILEKHRLDTGAKSLADLLAERNAPTQ